MHTVDLFKTLITHHSSIALLLLFLGITIEGEFSLLLTGIAMHLGAISISSGVFIGIAGALSKTLIGYYLGVLFRKYFNTNKFFNYLDRRMNYILPKFGERPFWSIFISKFIYGVNHVVIIFCGFRKINIKTYLKAEIYSSFIWVLGILSIGYLFSLTALNISRDIRKFTGIILLLLIGFFIIERTVTFLFELFEDLNNVEQN